MGGFYSIHNKSKKELKYTYVNWVGRKRTLKKITSELQPFYHNMTLRLTRRGDGRTNDVRVYDLDNNFLVALDNVDDDCIIDEKLNIDCLKKNKSLPWVPIVVSCIIVCIILFILIILLKKQNQNK